MIKFRTALLSAAATLSLSIGTAHAQPMPNFDVVAACRASGSMLVSEKDCVAGEYSFRGMAASEWAGVSPAARQECLNTAYGDYENLFACIYSHKGDTYVPPVPAFSAPPVYAAPAPAGDVNVGVTTNVTVNLPPAVVASAAPPAPPPLTGAMTGAQQGWTDRQAWESWIATLTGDYRTGAIYWSGQRSLPHPGLCAFLGGDAINGCTAAKARLDISDYRRKTEPDYRLGWNGLAPISQ
jgi:hypothetical protein